MFDVCVFVVADFAVDRFGDDVSLFVANGLDRNSKSLAWESSSFGEERCKGKRRREQPSRSQFHHGTVFSLRTLSVGITKPDNLAQDKIFTGGGATLCKCIGRIYIVPRATIPSNKSSSEDESPLAIVISAGMSSISESLCLKSKGAPSRQMFYITPWRNLLCIAGETTAWSKSVAPSPHATAPNSAICLKLLESTDDKKVSSFKSLSSSFLRTDTCLTRIAAKAKVGE